MKKVIIIFVFVLLAIGAWVYISNRQEQAFTPENIPLRNDLGEPVSEGFDTLAE